MLSAGQTLRLSCIDIEPNSASTALISPIQIVGTCNSSGCPQVRVDNIGFGLTTPWTESGNGNGSAWLIRTDNVFGVIDHNSLPSGNKTIPLAANLSAYLGVGSYGDNSWAQPDSFGTANVLYLENNNFSIYESMTETEIAPAGGNIGGARLAGRFNQINMVDGSYSVLEGHGLDTDGRPRSIRHSELYGNTISCPSGSCGVIGSFRGGTGLVFSNSITTGAGGAGWFNQLANITVYRSVYSAPVWGACGGSSPYDTDAGTTYYSGTNSGSSGSTTLTDTTKAWTTNQLIPIGAPYSVYDVTQGWWAEIASNTATTLTIQPSIPEQTNTFKNGDSYEILRATVCVDQGGRGAGAYVSGSTPSPASALSEVLDPIYEWDDAVTGSLTQGNVGTDTGRTIANRDWYTDGSNGSPHAQTSPTSPFNGSSGVGFGTLANRPTSCTPRVGYWATDQGNWNQSGSGGQGELFTCTTTNTWTLSYTPYTYPHPLDGDSSTLNPPNPPTGLTAAIQ